MKKRKGEALLAAVIVSMFVCGMIAFAITKIFGIGTASVNVYNRNLQARQYALNISEEISALDFDKIVDKKTEELEQIADSDYYKMVDITTDLTVVPNVRKANISVYHKDNLINAVSNAVVTKYSDNEKDVLYESVGENTDNSITEEALYTTYLTKRDAVFASGKVGSEINPVYVDEEGNLMPTDIVFRNQYNPVSKKLAVWNGNEIDYMDIDDIAVPIGGPGLVNTNSYIKFPNGLILNFGYGAYYDLKPFSFKTLITNHICTVYDLPLGIRYGKWRSDYISNESNLYGGFINAMYYFTVGAPLESNSESALFYKTEGGVHWGTGTLEFYNDDGYYEKYNVANNGAAWRNSVAAGTHIIPYGCKFRLTMYPKKYYENGEVSVAYEGTGQSKLSHIRYEDCDVYEGITQGPLTRLYFGTCTLTEIPPKHTVVFEPAPKDDGEVYPSYRMYRTEDATTFYAPATFEVSDGEYVRLYMSTSEDSGYKIGGYYVNDKYYSVSYTKNNYWHFQIKSDTTIRPGPLKIDDLGRYEGDSD